MFKSLLITAVAICTATATPSILQNFDDNYSSMDREDYIEDFQMFSKIFYSTYNGFVRGFYHEHQREVVSKECLGDWVTKNLTYLDMVWQKIADMEILTIPYEDAVEAAKDVVDLIYKNREYCQIDKVFNDINELCDEEDITEIDIWKNIRSNLFPIAAKLEPMIEWLFSDDLQHQSDEEVLQWSDQMGESYGAVVSYIIGFNKSWKRQ